MRDHPFSEENMAAASHEVERLSDLLEPWNRRAAPCDLGEFFARHERVFLAFSGGRDSLALLHMCAPWAGKLSLLWVNTGAMLPQTESFCRSFGASFDLIEIKAPSIRDHWEKNGSPTDLMPIEIAGRSAVTPWVSCCVINRVTPMANYLRSVVGSVGFLFSHRRSDPVSLAANLHSMIGPHVEVENPLYAWSDEDVAAYLDKSAIPLPEHYAAGVRDSMDCAICPARMTRERMAYLRQKAPDAAAIAEAAGQLAMNEAADAWRGMSDVFGEKGTTH